MFSPPRGDRSGSVPPANGLQQHPAVPNHQPGVSFQPQQPPSVPVINPPPFLQTSGSQAGSYVPQQQQQNVSSVDPVTLQLFQQMQQQINLQFQQQQAFLTQQLDVFRTAMSAIQVSVPTNPEQILDSLACNIREFRYEPDQNVTFGGWFVRYEDLFAKDAVRLDDEAKVRLLLRKLGPSEHERYTSYILPKSPNAIRFDDTVSKLKSLFGTPESVISRRYRCLQVKKQVTEDYKTFACRVNKLCVEFELGKLSEDQFKCLMFVCGLKAESDAEIRTRLLSRIEERDDVTLEQISDECQRLLNIKHDTAMIESASSSAAVQSLKKQDGKKNYRSERGSAESRSSPQKGARPATPCWNCGAMHYSRDCPFQKNRCKECGQTGHKDGYCSSAKKIKSPSKRYTGRQANTRSVQVKNIRKRRRFVKAEVNGRQVSLQLDTASDISIISEQTWQKIGQPASTPATVQAATASGKPLKLQFQCCCEVAIKGEKRTGRFFVVKQQLNLLGLDLIDAFNLGSVPMDQFCNQVRSSPTSVSSLKAAFPGVFSDAPGLCTKAKVKFTLKEGKSPVFRPKRPVAYAMYSTVDAELDRLENANIITPVDFSEWAAPIVVVRKASGAVRICGDYSTGLNDALQPHQYPLPLPEDIFAKLANCKVFSQIDLSDAFLQVEMDESCREMLTINTHRGLYRYNRLPPGVKAAPGAFQQLVDTMLAGLECTSGYLDDVLVGGVDEADHQRNLEAVLRRLQEFGFTIKAEKCSFGQKQIKYVGHLIDEQGLRPDPAKIEAICNMPAPTNVTEVRSFLGAINYYGKFVPSMRKLRYPLDELLKADRKFAWTAECEKSFTTFKQVLQSDLLLTHYNPQLPIVVSADASSVGVGATISHKFPDGSLKVVQHASRALTAAEQAYSQPDREGLAIIFAVTKFHKMLFGRHFTLQTDHAPLLRIFGSKKGIPVYTANRLQRWALQLLLYDFDIVYVNTEKFGNADVLSRLINQHVKPEEDFVVASVITENDVRSIALDAVDALPLHFRAIQQATRSDPVLSKVYRYIQQGWPNSKTAIQDREVQRFFDRSDSLSTVQGCVMFAERLVIPSGFRMRCLHHLHRGHPGIQRMKAIARSYVYWPSIDSDIAAHVSGCRSCAAAAKSPPKSAPLSWPKSTHPWQRVHIDYAGPIEGEYFLLSIDSHSKWVEIVRTKSITASTTIGILRSLFARLGMPETLVSDNGTQFTSAEFAQFCLESGINHVTTAPFHPQSNGQAERFVDTFKRAIKKIRKGRGAIQEALDTFLMTYRSSPNPSAPEGKSPSEVMFGRKIRTSLDLLRPPTTVQPSNDHQAARSFGKGDLVYAKVHSNNSWRWAPAVVLERIGNVMFNVWVEDRRMLRSHINQLRSRAGADNTPNPSTIPSKAGKHQLPLDILLQACNLHQPSHAHSVRHSPSRSPSLTLAPSVPVAQMPSTLAAPSEHSTPLQATPAQPSLVWVSPATTETRESSSVSASTSRFPSSATSSAEFMSATETETAGPLPRRSSRQRRPPIRFDPYQLY
ncbi:uncharacterized protein K02A2.6-like [Aedes albopictus]|uniref:RNA-directed DNA polymerase n=1 Tax=Aedes albopictus TaxID=7160 RepID=A0ABM1YJW5_AEDAL